MKYMSTFETAKKWGISHRRVSILCNESRIPGAQRAGSRWIIPADAKKPDDARIKSGKYIQAKTGNKTGTTDSGTILKGSENANIEVKPAQNGVPDSVWKTYSSFANTSGGTIILEISEDEKTEKPVSPGFSDTDKIIAGIWNTLNNPRKISRNILTERNIRVQPYEGKNRVLIEVPRAERTSRPVYVGTDMFKGSYRRNHEGDYLCTKDEVMAMIRDSSETSADSIALDNAGLDALNEGSIKHYRNRFKVIRRGHIWNGLPDDEFLIKIGAAKVAESDGKIHPTLGGLIFFGDCVNIIKKLPDFFLEYREKLATDTCWTDRICSDDGDWSGNVHDFYFKIADRLTSDVKKPFLINAQLLRDDDTDIHKAVREALANALIHADYYGRQGIVIEKDFRTMKFSNPGLFRISVDDAIAGGTSDARNGIIQNMFALINIGGRSGMGLYNICNSWNAYGYIQPAINETLNPDRVTLTLRIEYNNDGTKDKENGNFGTKTGTKDNKNDNFGTKNKENDNFGTKNKENGNFGTKVDTKTGIRLSENEEAVYNCVRLNTEITIKAVSDNLGISPRTVQRCLNALKEYGFIIREGSKTCGKWKILK